MQPGAKALSSEQLKDAKTGSGNEDKDDKYKSDKTGQYVSKDVQVTGYEDGSERPTRPKHDDAKIQANYILPDDPCESCGGGGISGPTSTFRSSEGLGHYIGNPAGEIYSLRLIVGSSSTIQPTQGHIKIASDLNKGAGGKYIYLTFTRDTAYTYENDMYHAAGKQYVPIRNILVESFSQVAYNFPTTGIAPGYYYRHIYKFDGTYSDPVDLNDGAGGKYIFGHVSREASQGGPIKEVGILSGSSSSIQPPSGWIKVAGDLNEGAGGDYIYFCYRR